jgi:hypothetical protein
MFETNWRANCWFYAPIKPCWDLVTVIEENDGRQMPRLYTMFCREISEKLWNRYGKIISTSVSCWYYKDIKLEVTKISLWLSKTRGQTIILRITIIYNTNNTHPNINMEHFLKYAIFSLSEEDLELLVEGRYKRQWIPYYSYVK